MCAGNDHLLRVGPFIIARRYSYGACRASGWCQSYQAVSREIVCGLTL
jgi:hypothetical protein